MKKNVLLASCLISLMFVNCSKDDGVPSDSDTGLVEVVESVVEEEEISISVLEKGISIEGASLKSGELTPNEQTSFSVDETELSGFQDVGFDIELNVPEDYAGAYLQIISEDGTASDNYYDIPSSIYYYKNSEKKTKLSFFNKETASGKIVSAKDEEEVNEVTIEVDFDGAIPAGSFCYYLCIYDADGNISAPQNICVEVEEWGGNDNLVGNWVFEKIVTTTNGISETVEDGEKDFDSYTTHCKTGIEYDVDPYFVIENFLFNLNANGSQSYSADIIDSSIDFESFDDNCEVKYDIYTENVNYTGNWAYDEEEEKLTLVDYTYNVSDETKNGEPYVDPYDYDEVYETGIGFDLYLVSVTSSELVVEFREEYTDYNYDESTGEYTTSPIKEVITYYFTK